MKTDNKKKKQDKRCLTNEKLEKVSGGKMGLYTECVKCGKLFEGPGVLCDKCQKQDQ